MFQTYAKLGNFSKHFNLFISECVWIVLTMRTLLYYLVVVPIWYQKDWPTIAILILVHVQ